LVTFKGFRNTEKMVELERGLRDSVPDKRGLVDMSLRVVLRLRYKDVLGRAHSDYFDVKPIAGSFRLTDKVGQECFQRWNSADWLEVSGPSALRLLDRAGSAAVAVKDHH